MENIEFYRKKIEEIDEEITKLLVKRMKLSLEIGQYKKSKGLPVYDPKREEELRNKNLQKVEEKYQAGYSEIFESILKVSKQLQL